MKLEAILSDLERYREGLIAEKILEKGCIADLHLLRIIGNLERWEP